MTMVRKLGDRILRLLLPEISAGACIPDIGCCCKLLPGGGYAWNWRLSCNGVCVRNDNTRCRQGC
jgi:hypothetical protein